MGEHVLCSHLRVRKRVHVHTADRLSITSNWQCETTVRLLRKYKGDQESSSSSSSSSSSHRLTAEAVQRTTLTLQSVDDVHRGDRLALSVLRVGDGVANHVLEEHLQHAARLLVDQARDALHAAATSQTTDRRLSDSLDVVAQHFPMTFGASCAHTHGRTTVQMCCV